MHTIDNTIGIFRFLDFKILYSHRAHNSMYLYTIKYYFESWQFICIFEILKQYPFLMWFWYESYRIDQKFLSFELFIVLMVSATYLNPWGVCSWTLLVDPCDSVTEKCSLNALKLKMWAESFWKTTQLDSSLSILMQRICSAFID